MLEGKRGNIMIVLILMDIKIALKLLHCSKDWQTPTKCSHPKMLTKKRMAGMNQVKTIITITWCWYSDDDEDCDDDVGDVGDDVGDYEDESRQDDHHDKLLLIILEMLSMKLSNTSMTIMKMMSTLMWCLQNLPYGQCARLYILSPALPSRICKFIHSRHYQNQ